MGHLPQPAGPHPAWLGRHPTVYKGLSSTVLPGPGSAEGSAPCSGQGNWGPVKGKDLSPAPKI